MTTGVRPQSFETCTNDSTSDRSEQYTREEVMICEVEEKVPQLYVYAVRSDKYKPG